MSHFSLKNSDGFYLSLSDQPKKFDADSPVTNVFFDDTNGQVFTVRSGGVTGVTVSGLDDSKTTSFRMEDRGSIISIKFSPDYKVLAIQRNLDSQSATVEFLNFKDLVPTNVEYSHTCKWKNAKILGFVWPKVNEIAFITDHGIELLQTLPEKKQLKSLKNISFSGAWFTWCSQSNIILLAGNNGALLQPFALNSSSITKLQKIELDSAKPVVERDVFVLRVCNTTWCAVFHHGNASANTSIGPTELWLMAVTGAAGSHFTHVLKTGLAGRFAVNVVDDLIVVHHQSSQTSQLFDIMEESKPENNLILHLPIVSGTSMKPVLVEDRLCPMYSGTWVVFQPDYIIDARLGCLWRLHLLPQGLAHSVPKDELGKMTAVLLRRIDGKETIYRILHQLVSEAGTYLAELTKIFDEINYVYKKSIDLEVARNTAGLPVEPVKTPNFQVVISQADVCNHILQAHLDDKYIVQVVTAYLSSLWRAGVSAGAVAAETAVRALARRGAWARLAALARRGALGEGRALACALLSLHRAHPPAAQLAADMMWRLRAYQDVVEVLLGWGEAVAAAGAARTAGGAWAGVAPRKLLAAAQPHPPAFLAVYHALLHRNERLRHDTNFVKADQCDGYVEYYKQITAE